MRLDSREAAGSEETRGELEAYKARAEDEMGRLNERMRGMADSELRLRHELQDAERGRQELQERVVELSGAFHGISWHFGRFSGGFQAISVVLTRCGRGVDSD